VAITLEETFVVRAPLEAVWAFVMDPQQVALCMPGAQLDEVVDERTFLGAIKVKVGAVTTTYQGRVSFSRVDEAAYVMEMLAEGRETGGGIAKGTMSSRLQQLANGATEVTVTASVDVTGRIAQVGRGMIQGVSQELFRQFVSSVQARLEAPEGTLAAPARQQPIAIVPLLLRVTWAAIVRFFRRLLRRPA